MYGAWGEDIDISEYLARLPDRGRCVTNPRETFYVQDDEPTFYDEDLPRLDIPRIAGLGPVECSTCTDLALMPEVIWDTNYYYRKLGFSWPYTPAKKQLRIAFQDNDGSNNAWLMMAFKTLVSDTMRRIYDCTPLGQRFLDAEVQEAFKREAIKEAVRRRKLSNEDVEAEEVLEEWGLTPKPKDGYGEGTPTPEGKEPSDPRRTVREWRWSYYLWRSSEGDTERLAVWQQLLVSVFAARHMRRKFSVGFFGKQSHRCLSAQVDGRLVLFLNEDEMPDEELAQHMVTQVLLDDTRKKIGAGYDYPQLQSRW